MGMAMLKYMPLRGLLSFGGGDAGASIEELIKNLNQ